MKTNRSRTLKRWNGSKEPDRNWTETITCPQCDIAFADNDAYMAHIPNGWYGTHIDPAVNGRFMRSGEAWRLKPVTIRSRFPGKCKCCGGWFPEGTMVRKGLGTGVWVHQDCDV
jgi:uncharacterized C2H2 Zn-finger protein